MVFQASQTVTCLYDEMTTPYEIVASSGNKQINLDDLSSIEGVEAVSPVLQANCQVAYEDKIASFVVNAVYSGYLNIRLINGVVFSDDTNMPYLLLNESAAKTLSGENSDTAIQLPESLIIKFENTEYKAIISGVFQDDDTNPKVYMSYDVARKLFPGDGNTKVNLRLNNKGSVESVVLKLQNIKYSATNDSNAILSWELLRQQTGQSVITGIGYLMCSMMLLRNNIINEYKAKREEINTLLLSGMTLLRVRGSVIIRLLFLNIICLTLICCVAYLTGKLTFVAIVTCSVFLLAQHIYLSAVICQFYK